MSVLIYEAETATSVPVKRAKFLAAFFRMFGRGRRIRMADPRMLRDIGITHGEAMDDADMRL